MNTEKFTQHRILAISPTSRGFGYAVMEAPLRLIDWGVVQTKKDLDKRITRLSDLIRRYVPTVLVTEDFKSLRKGPRAKNLIQSIGKLSYELKIPIRKVGVSKVRNIFQRSGAITKLQIAHTIGRWFPELATRLPKPRKIGMGENYRMSIFDAIGLAISFYQ